MEFNVKPGDRVVVAKDEPTAVLIYDGIPDWVTLPAELGGTRVNVKHGVREQCPCKGDHEALILTLDEPTGIMVAECMAHGFLWFRRRAEP